MSKNPLMRDGLHYIVLASNVNGNWLKSNYSVHEQLEDARDTYDKILTAPINQELYSSVTIAAVIESTDYDTHPYVSSLERRHEP